MPDTEVVDHLPAPSKKDGFFKRVRGSDPCAQTCRGKLQFRRSKLNQNINKHLMLRQGAENLLRATDNKWVREAATLELSFVNSSLQLLREELSDLNSSMEIYQSEEVTSHIPMIPFGFKETKYINFTDVFKDFIMEHYSEDSSQYLGVIQDFTDLRQAIRRPQRTEEGIRLQFRYYNQLYFVERRFFPTDRYLGILFEWYDSLTGLPSIQRSVAFEKASVLFNLAATYSQIAARQSRNLHEQLDTAVDNYLRAAGVYRYILDNFSNAPSRDLNPDILQVLSSLLLSQAAECLLERMSFTPECQEGWQYSDNCQAVLSLVQRLELAQEARQLAEDYKRLYELMSNSAEETVLPLSWPQLVRVKSVYYVALAHFHIGSGLVNHEGPISRKAMDLLHLSQMERDDKIISVQQKIPRNTQQRQYIGKCHLREAVLLFEECHRLLRMSRELKKHDQLQRVLNEAHEFCSDLFTLVAKMDELNAPIDPPDVIGRSKFQLELLLPEFGQYPAEDMFAALGPLEVFNCHRHWSAPRLVQLERGQGEGLGFSVKMEAPAVIVGVEPGSLAERVGLKDDDYIVAIEDRDMKWSTHAEVVTAIRRAESDFNMHVVTPLDKATSVQESGESLPPTATLSNCSGVFSNNTWSSASTSSGVSSNGTGGFLHSTALSSSSTAVRTPSSSSQNGTLLWSPIRRFLSSARKGEGSIRTDSGVGASSPCSTIARSGR